MSASREKEEVQKALLRGGLALLHAQKALQGDTAAVIQGTVDITDGLTLLHLACAQGHLEVVQALLENQKAAETIGAKSKQGRAPLHVAAEKGHSEIVKLLIAQPEGESIVCLQDSEDGSTPLHLAAEFGHVDVVRVLIAFPRGKEAICIQCNRLRRTPLHWAALKGHLEIVNVLIGQPEGEGTVCNQDDAGQMPLHLAATAGQLEIVHCLLVRMRQTQAGALRTKDVQGRTALDCAKWQGHSKVVNLLHGMPVGCGNARDVALRDDRQIMQITWMTQPVMFQSMNFMPNWALPSLKELDIRHSFLVVTVADDRGRSSDKYVIEKCQTDDDAIESGILVTRWDHTLMDDTMKVFAELDSADMRTQDAKVIRDLWAVAVSTGKYTIRSHCHDAAKAMYNACAAQCKAVECRPINWRHLAAKSKPSPAAEHCTTSSASSSADALEEEICSEPQALAQELLLEEEICSEPQTSSVHGLHPIVDFALGLLPTWMIPQQTPTQRIAEVLQKLRHLSEVKTDIAEPEAKRMTQEAMEQDLAGIAPQIGLHDSKNAEQPPCAQEYVILEDAKEPMHAVIVRFGLDMPSDCVYSGNGSGSGMGCTMSVVSRLSLQLPCGWQASVTPRTWKQAQAKGGFQFSRKDNEWDLSFGRLVAPVMECLPETGYFLDPVIIAMPMPHARWPEELSIYIKEPGSTTWAPASGVEYDGGMVCVPMKHFCCMAAAVRPHTPPKHPISYEVEFWIKEEMQCICPHMNHSVRMLVQQTDCLHCEDRMKRKKEKYSGLGYRLFTQSDLTLQAVDGSVLRLTENEHDTRKHGNRLTPPLEDIHVHRDNEVLDLAFEACIPDKDTMLDCLIGGHGRNGKTHSRFGLRHASSPQPGCEAQPVAEVQGVLYTGYGNAEWIARQVEDHKRLCDLFPPFAVSLLQAEPCKNLPQLLKSKRPKWIVINGHTVRSDDGQVRCWEKPCLTTTWGSEIVKVLENLEAEICAYLSAPGALECLNFLWLAVCTGAPIARRILKTYDVPMFAWDCPVYEICVTSALEKFFELYVRQNSVRPLREVWTEAHKQITDSWPQDRKAFQVPKLFESYGGLVCDVDGRHELTENSLAARIRLVAEPEKLSRELHDIPGCQMVVLLGAPGEDTTTFIRISSVKARVEYVTGASGQRGETLLELVVVTEEPHGMAPGDMLIVSDNSWDSASWCVEERLSETELKLEVNKATIRDAFAVWEKWKTVKGASELLIKVGGSCCSCLLNLAKTRTTGMKYAVLLGQATEEEARKLAKFGVSCIAWTGEVGNVQVAEREVLKFVESCFQQKAKLSPTDVKTKFAKLLDQHERQGLVKPVWIPGEVMKIELCL